MGHYRYHHVVTFDETNLVGNVYFAQYLHWQGHCRELFLADHAPSVIEDVKSGQLALVTLNCQMSYFEECVGLDKIDVQMVATPSNGNRIGMNFEFSKDDVRIAEGSQTVACMRRSGNGLVPTPIPDELATAIANYL